MKSKLINATHVEGILYEHNLEFKVSGEQSKNPGTQYIRGSISIATNDALTNIVPIFFTYVTAKTSKGKDNKTYEMLSNIINGTSLTYMATGNIETAQKLRVDSGLNLNEFFTNRDGADMLISSKRVEGGFIHPVTQLNPSEKDRATFDVDMFINKVREVDENEEKQLPAKLVISGSIFDFRKSLLPVEFSVINPDAMDYFRDLDISDRNPVFTRLKGEIVSNEIKRVINEESAFGEDSVRTVTNRTKDFVINWAQKLPYELGLEETLTSEELTKAIADRNLYLDTLKSNYESRKDSNAIAPKTAVNAPAAAPKKSGTQFNF